MIVLSSPAEIRRWRTTKLLLTVPLLVLTAWAGVSAANRPKAGGNPLERQPTVALETREDWPIEIQLEKPVQGALPTGVYVLAGRGPRNTTATIYEGDSKIMTAPIEDDGRWNAAVRVNEAGLMSFHVEIARGRIPAGRSKSLPLTFTNGVAKKSDDVGLSNYTSGEKVPAGTISLEGFAPPADFVRVYADKVELGRAEVDLDGHWTLDVEINNSGKRSITVFDEITEHTSGAIELIVSAR